MLCLWVALRTLLSFKGRNDEEERCRRALFLLLLGFIASGWMINRQYHTEYFLLVAVAAALHRLRLASEAAGGAALLDEDLFDVGGDTSDPMSAASVAALPNEVTENVEPQTPVRPIWNRLGVLDLAAAGGMTWGVLWIWDYILKNL